LDGRSNTIYVGNADNLLVIQEVQANPNIGSAKYYTSTYISEEMQGNIAGMWPAIEASGNLADISPRTATGALTAATLTYGVSGVRGNGITLGAVGSTANSANANLLFAELAVEPTA